MADRHRRGRMPSDARDPKHADAAERSPGSVRGRGTAAGTAHGVAEADWEQTLDAISDPVAVLTPEYRVVRANAAYITWMHTTRGRCEGHECFVHQRRHDGPCDQCPLPRAVVTGQPGFVRQTRMQPDGPGGSLVPHIYETWTYPVKNASGVVERVVEIIKDVTERERLRQVTSEAEALRVADRLKAELLGTVSHELRSPLASIKGYAATLLKHERDLSAGERHEFLEAIVQASDRLEEVIDRMLEMSQLETGTVRLGSAWVDLEQLARDAVRDAQRRGAERGADRFTFSFTLRFASEPRQSPAVVGDRRRLREVLDQLLENAMKYSPNGGTIDLTIQPYFAAAHGENHGKIQDARDMRRDEELAGALPREMVEIVVRDSGIGIPAEHLDRVFERFHRVDTRLTREAEGLGLGLAIAKRVIELHDGTIWAESVAQGGSAFHVVLPLASSTLARHSTELDDVMDGMVDEERIVRS